MTNSVIMAVTHCAARFARDMMGNRCPSGTPDMLVKSLFAALVVAALWLGFGAAVGLWLTISIACGLLALLLLRRAYDPKAWCIAALFAVAVWMPFFLMGCHE